MPEQADLDFRKLFNEASLPLTDQEAALLRGAFTGLGGTQFNPSVLSLYSARINKQATDSFASAVERAAQSSDRNSRSIARATWFLFASTLALFLVALGNLVMTIWLYT